MGYKSIVNQLFWPLRIIFVNYDLKLINIFYLDTRAFFCNKKFNPIKHNKNIIVNTNTLFYFAI